MLKRLPKPLQYAVYLAVFLIGLAGGTQLIQYLQGTGDEIGQALIDQPGPDFTLPDLDRVMHRRAEWEGRVVVLNFWASWCAPCREEMPLFVDLQNQYGDQGLQFVGIAIDERDKARAFAREFGVNYPVLFGSESAMAVARDYGNRLLALPYTVILDRDGRIQWITRGKTERDAIEPAIRAQL